MPSEPNSHVTVEVKGAALLEAVHHHVATLEAEIAELRQRVAMRHREDQRWINNQVRAAARNAQRQDADRIVALKAQVSRLEVSRQAPPPAPRIPGWFNVFRMYSCGWGATAGCMMVVREMQHASVSNPMDWALGCIGLLSLAGLLSAAWHFAPGGGEQ